MKSQLKLLRRALVIGVLIVLAGTGVASPSYAAESSTPSLPGRVVQAGYSNCAHVVLYGETMTMIAARYGTTIYQLMRANFMPSPNLIYRGMRLRVPCVPFIYPRSCIRAIYIVRRGDNLFRIGLRFGISWIPIAIVNGLRNPNLIWVGMHLGIPCRSISAPGYSPSYAPTYPQPTPVAGGNQLTVLMRNIAFNPANINIKVGQTVLWRNNEPSAIPHTTTSGSCSGSTCTPAPGWNSGTLNPGQTFSHAFTAAGIFTYYCQIHGAQMQGTVSVTP